MAEAGKAKVDGVALTDGPAVKIFPGKVLTREVAAALCVVNRELFTAGVNLEVGEAGTFIANQLAVRLEKLIYTSPLGLFEVEYPATPWEHFRAVHFPKTGLGRWFLKRKPVRMHYERRSVAVSFPESQYELHPTALGRPVYLVRDEHMHRY